MSGTLLELPSPDDRGPWGSAVLDCRACGHTQVSTAPLDVFETTEAFECARCHEMAAGWPWAVCETTCPCGQAVRAVLWERVDITPTRWPCGACGRSVPIP